MYFRYFTTCIISPWKKAQPFIRTYLNSLHPRIVCVKFSWNWPIDSISNLERAWHFIRTNLNDALCQVRLKLPCWLWRRGWKWWKLSQQEQTNSIKKLTWAFSSGIKLKTCQKLRTCMYTYLYIRMQISKTCVS